MEETEKNLKAIRESLDNLDLSSQEQEIFLFLVEMKSPWPTSAIARELEIYRQTLFSNLKSMTERQLLTETRQGKNAYFQTDFHHLEKYVNLKLNTLESSLLLLRHLLKSNQQ